MPQTTFRAVVDVLRGPDDREKRAYPSDTIRFTRQ